MIGYIHSFESLAALDGDGLRYGVFLMGCPLRCIYCHNPDTWIFGENAPIKMTPNELCAKILRYKPYFKGSGGATFSGGEPLLQALFLRETAGLLKEKSVGYVLDTSGAVPLNDDVKYLLENADTVLLDIKFPSDEQYLKYTGRDMKKTLKTLEFLENVGTKVYVRTVVVPEINDREDYLLQYTELIKKYTCVKKYELLAFHTMGFYKYRELGCENKLENIPPLSKERLSELQKFVDGKLKI